MMISEQITTRYAAIKQLTKQKHSKTIISIILISIYTIDTERVLNTDETKILSNSSTFKSSDLAVNETIRENQGMRY